MPVQDDVLIIPPGEGRPLNASASIRCRVSADQTGGAYTVLELRLAPGEGAPLHVHRREDEIFHILEGECAIGFKDQISRATQGSTAVLPKNLPHFFKNEGARPARILITAVPGGLEKFFEEIDRAVSSGEAVAEKIAEISNRYEIEFFS